MERAASFVIDAYEFFPAEGKLELHYALDDAVQFTETFKLPAGAAPPERTEEVERTIAALHIAGGVSYYKTCIPPRIDVRSSQLAPEQARFWHDFYENGLGEFFYRNQIDYRGLVKVEASAAAHPSLGATQTEAAPTTDATNARRSSIRKPRLLVPLGGGKDSLVTVELLKRAGYEVTLFRMGTHPLIEEEARIAGLPLLTVERTLSPALFELNKQGALNGHVPITGYLSFLAILVAQLTGHDAVVLSAERSASEGNVHYHGTDINHQWSKSLEFERSMRRYLHEHAGTGVEYFSLLRPLSELHIAKLCSELPQYFSTFTSCNANWKILEKQTEKRWCGKCPKCAFAFALFSAFLPREQMQQIFGADLFADASLLPLFRELLGLIGHKPFECVGTPEETAAAFLLAHERGEWEESAAMQMFLKEVKPLPTHTLVEELLTPSEEHAIPTEFLTALPAPTPASPHS